jgi:hypothetical protein
MKKITELTAEQKAAMPVYRDKWIQVGLSCGRVNFEIAKIDLIKAYECANLPAPGEIVFARGPNEAIRLAKQKDPSLSAADVLTTTMFGSQEAGWLSFYNYFEEQCDLEFPGLEGLTRLAYNSGWITVFDEWACIHDRPLYIKLDEQNRLHCENGPAIEYGDGTAVYSWHGTSIPELWITDKEKALTADIALTWNNIEQRRAACEILGWVNILDKLDATLIDEDEDPMIGSLLEVSIPDIGREKFLKVQCGTGRTFAIPVPPNMKTALEGNAWTFGLNPEQLRDLEIRT